MKILLALALSLAIHLGVYTYFQNSKVLTQQTVSKKPEGKTSTHIQYVKLKKQKKPKKTIPKKITTPKIVELPQELKPKPKPKPKPKKKIVKKAVQKKPIIQKPKKVVINKQIQKIQQSKKTIDPPKIKERKKDLLEDADPMTKEYAKLYDNFDQLPTKTKVFIIKNIKDIGEITGRYLIYPMMSAQAGQEGVNIVEFMLFPDGKISTPIIIKSSKYFLLDDNTVETIQEAYHDYPRPQKPTPIRIFVKYHLIRN